MDKLTDGDTVKAATVTPTFDLSLKPMSTDVDGVPIRLGDYVTFYDKMFAKHRGVVRWIGTNKSFQPDGTPIVGIDAVSDTQVIVYYKTSKECNLATCCTTCVCNYYVYH